MFGCWSWHHWLGLQASILELFIDTGLHVLVSVWIGSDDLALQCVTTSSEILILIVQWDRAHILLAYLLCEFVQRRVPNGEACIRTVSISVSRLTYVGSEFISKCMSHVNMGTGNLNTWVMGMINSRCRIILVLTFQLLHGNLVALIVWVISLLRLLHNLVVVCLHLRWLLVTLVADRPIVHFIANLL